MQKSTTCQTGRANGRPQIEPILKLATFKVYSLLMMKSVLFFATILLCFTSASAQVNLNNGLTACYALDGNAIEPISGLTGTLSGPTPTVNRFNAPNSALYFNGINQFIELPDNPLLKPANAMSFSCWLYGTQLSNFYIMLTLNNLGSNFEAYELCVDPSLTFMSRKVGPSGLNQVNSTTQYTTNTWYHLAITIDNSFVKLYVNGQLEASTAATFNGFDYQAGKKVMLGASNEWYDGPFKGILDNSRFYDRAINAAEVLALFNTDPSCQAGPNAVISAPSTVCVGATVQFTNASTNNPTQLQWTMPGSALPASTSQNPQTMYATAGTYTVSLLASNAVGSSTTSTIINVLPAPSIAAAATKTLVCLGANFMVTGSGAATYTWQPGNSNSQTTFISLFSSTTLTLTGTGANGCSSVTYLPIQVQVCEGIDELGSAAEFAMSYNLAAKEVLIQTAYRKKSELRLYAYDAKLLATYDISNQSSTSLSTAELAAGIYLLVLETEAGSSAKKLIVQ